MLVPTLCVGTHTGRSASRGKQDAERPIGIPTETVGTRIGRKSVNPNNPVQMYFTPNLCFVTCEAVNRERVLDSGPKFHLLRSVLNSVKQVHPYQMLGYVFLPNHVHLLIKPEQNTALNTTLDQVVQAMIRQFNQDYQTLLGLPGRGYIWRANYQMYKIADVNDFARRLDYIHYNPVQHKLASRPEEWLQSSYETWVERGVYKLGWGWTEPESIKGKRWG